MYACVHVPGADVRRSVLLAETARRFSPEVEIASADTVVVGISALGRLMGTAHQIAAEIARRAHELGLDGNIGIARHPDTAILAARNLPGVTVIPPGEEARFLGELSLDALPVEQETLGVLRRWGIRTLAEFCELPEAGVVERLGAQGLALWKLARGASGRPLRPAPSTACYEEALELDHPVALLEPLLFLIARLMNQVCSRLQDHSMATTEMRLCLKLEDRSEHARTLQLPFPTRDARTLLKLVQLELEAHPPQAAIVAVALELKPTEPRRMQGGLYAPPRPEPEKLELTLGKIRALVGEDNAGCPELLDTHRPDAWRLHPAPRDGDSRPCPHLRLAFRYFRPALEARVELRAGAPVRVATRIVRGRVLEAAGPWRASGDWWTDRPWARDDWDIALDDGALYRIYLTGDTWFLEGSYD